MTLAEMARIRARLKYEYGPHADEVAEIGDAVDDIETLIAEVERQALEIERVTMEQKAVFQRGVEAFRKCILAFSYGVTSWKCTDESRCIIEEIPRMQIAYEDK